MSIPQKHNFLQRFYPENSPISWSKIYNRALEQEVLAKLEPWIDNVVQGRFPVILPREMVNGEMCWYALTDTESALVELGELLIAHVGDSYTDFVNQPYHLDPNDSVELAMIEAYSGLRSFKVFRFTVTAQDKQKEERIRQVFNALEILRKQLASRPARRLNLVRHRGRILRDINIALYRQDGKRAHQYLTELRRAGGIGEQNELFLELRCYAIDGNWEKIIDHPKLRIVMDLPRPRVLSEALIEAVYGYQLFGMEVQQDLDGQRQLFESNLAKSYRGLFLTTQKLTSPNAVKAYLLWLLSDKNIDPKSARRKAEKLARSAQCHSDGDRLWIDRLLAEFAHPQEQVPEYTVASQYSQATTLDDFQHLSLKADEDPQLVIDELVEGQWIDVPREKVVALALKCASYLASPEAAQQANSLLNELSEELQKQLLGKPVYAKFASEVRIQLQGQGNEITTWHDWLAQLIEDPNWRGAKAIAEEGSQHWSEEAMNCARFVELIECCAGSDDQRAAQALRDHLTSLATWLFNRESSNRWQSVWMILIELLALDENTSQEDMIFVTDLARGCLQGTVTTKEYSVLIEYMTLMQGACGAGSSVADIWLDMLELLVLYPCLKASDREELFLSVFNSFSVSPLRYSYTQWQALIQLCCEIGLPLAIPEVAVPNERSEEQQISTVDLNGKRIAIYTLTESVAHRVRDKLLELFPDADVRINSDKVATEKLKVLARESDYFIFSWLSSAHQAFYAIKAERKNRPLLQPRGKGSSSMLSCILDCSN